MKLSIITINYNNAEGLRKTLASVATQTYRNIEHIIVDGGSTDGSVDVIKEYAERPTSNSSLKGREVVWVSEPDKGIYNAMNKGIEIALGKRVVDTFNRSERSEDKNKGIEIAIGKRVVNALNRSELVEDKNKGIRKASGEYMWILNSGDCAAAYDVVEKMMNIIIDSKKNIPLLLGNILQSYSNDKKVCEKKVTNLEKIFPQPINASMFTFYRGTIPQDAAFIRSELFEKFGLFDESLKICADWKLYLNMIVLGGVVPMSVNIDVVLFDMSGISNTNDELRITERRSYLKEILPPSVLHDYDIYGEDIMLIQRFRRHSWAYRLMRLIERLLFKLEKWNKRC